MVQWVIIQWRLQKYKSPNCNKLHLIRVTIRDFCKPYPAQKVKPGAHILLETFQVTTTVIIIKDNIRIAIKTMI
ncbi:unnamed protein product [Parnassius mnemosyne]|uniref:Uncharacterized protein n=1 Tax=Parnassius mnemosyne TaxID=213953 RepID=A0AAV1LVV8_9NEOP